MSAFGGRALQAPHLTDPALSSAMAGAGGYTPSGLKIMPPQLGPVGYGAMWAAFVLFVLSTVYFLRASMASHSKARARARARALARKGPAARSRKR